MLRDRVGFQGLLECFWGSKKQREREAFAHSLPKDPRWLGQVSHREGQGNNSLGPHSLLPGGPGQGAGVRSPELEPGTRNATQVSSGAAYLGPWANMN